MTYTLEEVKKKTLEYFGGDDLATNVWIDKYCLTNLNGEFMEDSPLMMYKRLAKEFARIEAKYPNPIEYDEIHRLLKEQIILPGGSLLYGIGNNYAVTSLGNCFVIGNEADSIGGIFTTAQEQAQLMKRRAGVGHDISHLRGKGSPIKNSAKQSTGIATWEDLYSFTTRKIAQDGRRGALMMSCNINHPQSEEFIVSKDDTTQITGANISVKVDDVFMSTVESNYNNYLNKPLPDNIDFKAQHIWNKLIHQAWKTAEPGVLFWDTITRESPADCYEGFKSTSTNPCGEIPLCPYDSCRLLSVNLTKFVDNPFTSQASFNWDKFNDIVYKAQKLMDDVVDLEEEKINVILKKIDNDPEEDYIKLVEKQLWLKIKTKLLDGRRTGLSGIGLADALAMCNISYGSNLGNSTADLIYKELAISAYKSSIDMAKERGAFPIWKWSKEANNPFLIRIIGELSQTKEGYEDYALNLVKHGRRNIALLTIPPSGTISLLAKISSGVEPVFMLHHKRKRKVNPDHPNITFVDKNGDCWEEYVVLHPKFEEWFNKIQGESFKELVVFGKTEVPTNSPWHGSTAHELNPMDRVKMQAAIQKWVDHSISSTINLPKETTEEQVSEIYIQAWKQGCKGITIYRDGCRDGVLTAVEPSQKDTKFVTTDAPKRPKELICDIFTPKSHGQQYIVAVGILDGKPYEVFAFKFNGKFNINTGFIRKTSRGRYDILKLTGELYSEDITSEMSQIEEDRTRLISWGLRHGAGIKFLVEQLNKAKGNGFQSFSRVIARSLKHYIKDNEKVTGATCDNCGSSNLVYEGGCSTCKDCGSSKCG